MKSESMQHLNEDQIIQAVVDANDLPPSVQVHLAECSQCLNDRNSFEHEMILLGQKVEQFVPKPRRRIILPVQKTGNSFRNWLDWHNLAAAATTVAAVFILVWGTNLARNFSDPQSSNLTAEMMEAEILMTEVNTLVDNALPAFYLEISGEKNTGFDEEFYQFLIPTVEEKALRSRKQINKQGLRRILVRFQGAPKGAYCRYVTFGATPKAGQKSSKTVNLFVCEAVASDRGKKGTSLC